MAKRKEREREKKSAASLRKKQAFDLSICMRYTPVNHAHFSHHLRICLAVGETLIRLRQMVFVVKEIQSDWWHIHSDFEIYDLYITFRVHRFPSQLSWYKLGNFAYELIMPTNSCNCLKLLCEYIFSGCQVNWTYTHTHNRLRISTVWNTRNLEI